MHGDDTARKMSAHELVEQKLATVERYRTDPVRLTDRASDEQAEQYVEMLRDLHEMGKEVLLSDLVTHLLRDGYTHQTFLDFVAELIAEKLLPALPGQAPKRLRVRERRALAEAYPLFRQIEIESQSREKGAKEAASLNGTKTKIKDYIHARYGIEPRTFDRLMRDFRRLRQQDEILEDYERELACMQSECEPASTHDK